MTGDLDAEVPAFNNIFTGLAKLWPELPERLEVSKSTHHCGCRHQHCSILGKISCNDANSPKAKK
jgi:hypothetical protein